MGQYSIKELEKLSGIKAHTIRIWEQRYNLLDPKRTETNIRYYDDEQLKYLLNVVLLLKNGFRISQVSTFGPDRLVREIKDIHGRKLSAGPGWGEAGISAFIQAMVDFDEAAFDFVYSTNQKEHGTAQTITGLVYPFLQRIGVMWTTGEINPAHEHFICNLIRQKLIAAIDGLPSPPVGPPFLLCLPDGEYHETGLLMAHYFLKKEGRKTIYLGQSLPHKCIGDVVKSMKPRYVLSFLTNPRLKHCANDLAGGLQKSCGGTTLLMALPEGFCNESTQKDGVIFLHTMEELRQFV